MHGLKEMLGPANKHLEEERNEICGVYFKDNLSSHKTDAVFEFWNIDLPFFVEPVIHSPRY